MDDAGRYSADAGPTLAGKAVLDEGNEAVLSILGELSTM